MSNFLTKTPESKILDQKITNQPIYEPHYKQPITKTSDQISHDDPTHSENSESKEVVHGDDNLYFEMTLRKVAIA